MQLHGITANAPTTGELLIPPPDPKPDLWPSSGLRILRIGPLVQLRAEWGSSFPGQTENIPRAPTIWRVPAGFRPTGNPAGMLDSDGTNVGDALIYNGAFRVKGGGGPWRRAHLLWVTLDSWPAEYPPL